MKGQNIGLTTIDGHRPTAEEIEVRNEIRRTCDRMAKALSGCTANEIAGLAGSYSIIYTMGYHKLPEASFLDRQRDRLLRCWTAGDKSIEESDVYGMLSDSMRSPLTAMSPLHMQALSNLRKRWIMTLKKYDSFPDTDTYERYRRLALIMKDNVDSYFEGDSTAAKKAWFKKNKIAELSTVGTMILTAYRQFICSLFPAVLSSSKMTKLDISVLKELVTRKDLNEYDRKAYQMALAFDTKWKV